MDSDRQQTFTREASYLRDYFPSRFVFGDSEEETMEMSKKSTAWPVAPGPLGPRGLGPLLIWSSRKKGNTPPLTTFYGPLMSQRGDPWLFLYRTPLFGEPPGAIGHGTARLASYCTVADCHQVFHPVFADLCCSRTKKSINEEFKKSFRPLQPWSKMEKNSTIFTLNKVRSVFSGSIDTLFSSTSWKWPGRIFNTV